MAFFWAQCKCLSAIEPPQIQMAFYFPGCVLAQSLEMLLRSKLLRSQSGKDRVYRAATCYATSDQVRLALDSHILVARTDFHCHDTHNLCRNIPLAILGLRLGCLTPRTFADHQLELLIVVGLISMVLIRDLSVLYPGVV